MVASGFDCGVCGKTLASKSSLARHQHKYVDDPSKQLKGRIDKSSRNVGKAQSNSRTFDCDVCGGRFANKDSVTLHKKYMHRSDEEERKNFECDCCGKHLSTAANLRRHTLTHSS